MGPIAEPYAAIPCLDLQVPCPDLQDPCLFLQLAREFVHQSFARASERSEQ